MTKQTIKSPAGASVSVSILPEHTLQLDFDTANSSFDRADNDLTISFEDGGQIVIDDFFVTEGAALPNLVLSDGTEVTATDFLQSMNPDMDMTTAAGPTNRADGSGSGEYSDGAGELLSGLDRLGDLGAFQWNRSVEISGATESLAEPLGAIETGLTPGLPDEPEDDSIPYHMRAVLYRTQSGSASSDSDSMTIDLQDF